MSNRFSGRILTHLSDRRYRPRGVKALAEDLGIEPEAYEEFREAVTQLSEAGSVVLSGQGVVLPPPGREMTGTFRRHPRGFGFLVPDSPVAHGDLFIPPGQTGEAMTGDRVRARVMHQPRRGGSGRDDERSPYVGRIVEILQRGDHRYVGNLFRRGGKWLVQVDGTALPEPVLIRDPHARDAHEGDKVVIELVEYPATGTLAEGVIVEVLGERGEPDVETAAVMRAYRIKEGFDEAVLDEARQVSRRFDPEALEDREDLSGEFIITIDPPDARDFDDAIHIRKLDPHREKDSATWELGVHIADVAHFIEPGSALDEEAKERGNSVYLPRKVVPMLPEILSNGVCSLQEGVARYTKSAVIRYDGKGKVLGERFARTAIHSAKRLTYLEAQALIDGDIEQAQRHARAEPVYSDTLIKTLRQMDELARVIRRRRFDAGMIVLDLPEVELIFDESGRVVDAVPEDDAFTHRIIEMFMVEANEAAARLFDAMNVPMIRRVHADPPGGDLQELRMFARVAGYNIPANPTRQQLQQLLASVEGKPAQHAIHLAVLQTLARAEYSPLPLGHFALASEHYTHFTSPIRRYPDLIVHRGINAFLDARARHRRMKPKTLGKRVAQDDRVPDENTLIQLGRHCSVTERNAEAAERDLRTYLVLELLEQLTGETFHGTVTGVTGQGLYVQLDKYLVDGMLEVDQISGMGAADERWKLNRQTGAMTGQRSGATLQIGDRLKVQIVKVEPWARKLELTMLGPAAERGARKQKKDKRRQPAGAGRSQQLTHRLKQQKGKKRPPKH